MAGQIIVAGAPTNVVQLPTAAEAPIIQKRRPGSYGRKVVSFKAAQVRRAAWVWDAAHVWLQLNEARRSREELRIRATLKVLSHMHAKGEIDDLFICYTRVGQSGIQCVMPGERSKSFTAGATDARQYEERGFQLAADEVLELLRHWTEAVSGGETTAR